MDNELNKEKLLINILQEMKVNIENAIRVLGGETEGLPKKLRIENAGDGQARIIEGVFAGDKMVGSDGNSYNISGNYASKSRLVEGDILKLTVSPSGNFIYKQIGPIDRKRITGELIVDEEHDEYWVVSEMEKWKVLKESVTYYKGQTGNKAIFLVPQDSPAKWAALENVMKEED